MNKIKIKYFLINNKSIKKVKKKRISKMKKEMKKVMKQVTLIIKPNKVKCHVEEENKQTIKSLTQIEKM